jgi:hypothetical protein
MSKLSLAMPLATAERASAAPSALICLLDQFTRHRATYDEINHPPTPFQNLTRCPPPITEVLMRNEDSERYIDDLLGRSSPNDLDPIFEELGRAALPFGPGGAGDLIHAGKAWWAENEPELKNDVCGNPAVRFIAKDGPEKDAVLATAAAIETAYGLETALIAAVLILRVGLNKWCRTEWIQQDSVRATPPVPELPQ